jgi:murein DD-endopeptidase MepM/ murein hydrolase activator NlpD
LQIAKKTSAKYVTFLVMLDASSNPKSYRIKLSRLKFLAVVAGVFLVFAIGSLIFYYSRTYKVLYYDELLAQYQQLADDNRRIEHIEREYRKVKQENEKIRMVFGLLSSMPHDSSAEEKNRLGAEGSLEGPSDEPLVSMPRNVLNESEGRAWMPDFFMSARMIPSIMPVNSPFVSREFNTGEGVNRGPHFGVDIVAEEGAPVHATADGWVLISEWLADYGNTVIVFHGLGYFSVYKHLRFRFVKEGDAVKSGGILGTVGKTGALATGTHLHFEIWRDGHAVDPAEYIYQIRDAVHAAAIDTTN